MNEAFAELNDRLEAVENQRNHALRDAVILHAQLCAAKREVEALKVNVEALKVNVAALEARATNSRSKKRSPTPTGV